MSFWQRLLAFLGVAYIAQKSGAVDVITDAVGDINTSSNGRLTAKQVYNISSQIRSTYNLRPDPFFVTVIASLESSFNMRAYRNEPAINDASYGLMQTLWTTALDMKAKGYRAFPLDYREDLYNPYTSIYYGMAYLDWLMRYYPDNLENIARKYNGGPAGHTRTSTIPYLNKYRERVGIINAQLLEQGVSYG